LTVGRTGTLLTAGYLEEIDNNSETAGQNWTGRAGELGIAGRMMKNPHVRQSVNYLCDPIVASTPRFKPASKSALDREVADFCQWAFIERLRWGTFIRRAIRGYSANGFHLEEVTDDNVNVPAGRFPMHPGRGVGIAPTGYHERPANTVERWTQQANATECAESFEQWTRGSDKEDAGAVTVPLDRCIRFTWDQQGSRFTGFPVLRSVYQSWKLLIAFEEWRAIKQERLSSGVPTAILDEDATLDDLNATCEALAELRVGEKTYLVFPNGTEFEWNGLGEASVSDINKAIDACKDDIAVNVSAGFSRLGTGGGGGSHALGGVQQGTYHLTVEGHATFVAEAINLGSDGWSIVERIVRLNYGPEAGLPRLVFANLPTRDRIKTAKAYAEGVNAGALTPDLPTENQIRDALDYPPLDEETARPKAPPPATEPADEPEPEEAPEDDGEEETTDDE
jgi:hypothetical protein